MKVFGIHKGYDEYNLGTLLQYPISEFDEIFKNEIRIKIKIEDDDINKDVYLINYHYFINKDGIECEVEQLKEINSSNIIMSINGEKCEFQKYKKFNKKGEYFIILKFKNNLTSAKYMFLGCKNIIDIDLSSFDTRNITSMCGMFQDCNNINSIDLSSFDTQKVNDMQCMLYNCTNLNNIFFHLLLILKMLLK